MLSDEGDEKDDDGGDVDVVVLVMPVGEEKKLVLSKAGEAERER